MFVIKKRALRFLVLLCALLFLFVLSACNMVRDITDIADLPQASPRTQDMSEQAALDEYDLYSESGDVSGNDSNDVYVANIVDDNILPLSLEHDLGISINDQWFPIQHDVRGLLDAIDGNYVLSTAPSCVFEGEDKEFDFGGVLISTNPNPDGTRDIWFSIYITCEDFPTSRGVRVGSTLEEILAAYGSRYFWEGNNVITYSISGIPGDISSPCIQFTLSDGIVIAIEIYFPTNV